MANKKQKRERLSFRIPTQTVATLREIAKCSDVTVDQVVTVIIATRIVTERQARTVKPETISGPAMLSTLTRIATGLLELKPADRAYAMQLQAQGAIDRVAR